MRFWTRCATDLYFCPRSTIKKIIWEEQFSKYRDEFNGYQFWGVAKMLATFVSWMQKAWLFSVGMWRRHPFICNEVEKKCSCANLISIEILTFLSSYCEVKLSQV